MPEFLPQRSQRTCAKIDAKHPGERHSTRAPNFTVDFSLFDRRRYPVVSARAGYAEWADNYEDTVAVGLDRPLLDSLRSINWSEVRLAADLACGTGRTGTWLKEHGVATTHGVDLTPEMLQQAAAKRVYERLHTADVASTPLSSCTYDLCMLVLADEHLAELAPVYSEASRMLVPGGLFVLIGYHPFFLMQGLPTHYHRTSDREAVTIQSYVHLFSEHFEAAQMAGLEVTEFRECVIDEEWLTTKPKWRDFLNWPVSFGLVWKKSN
jgi:predicted TPR repeat methyltransferase